MSEEIVKLQLIWFEAERKITKLHFWLFQYVHTQWRIQSIVLCNISPNTIDSTVKLAAYKENVIRNRPFPGKKTCLILWNYNWFFELDKEIHCSICRGSFNEESLSVDLIFVYKESHHWKIDVSSIRVPWRNMRNTQYNKFW